MHVLKLNISSRFWQSRLQTSTEVKATNIYVFSSKRRVTTQIADRKSLLDLEDLLGQRKI